MLTHWGRVTYICVFNLTIIGSDNGLSPTRRQAIIWTNDGILLIEPLGTKFSEILIAIQTFSFKKMYLKMSSAKWRPSCLGLNVLIPECCLASADTLVCITDTRASPAAVLTEIPIIWMRLLIEILWYYAQSYSHLHNTWYNVSYMGNNANVYIT